MGIKVRLTPLPHLDPESIFIFYYYVKNIVTRISKKPSAPGYQLEGHQGSML